MKVKDLVPEIYYKESRDFSYIGRLFEVLFNYLKTNVDLVGETFINNEINASIVELVSTTLGFESKHQYQTKDLAALCSCFALLLRNKGNAQSISDAVTLLLHTQNIDDSFTYDVDVENHKFTIYVPSTMTDLVLLEDVFEYIFPTGWVYSFRYKASGDVDYSEKYVINMNTTTKNMSCYQLGQVSGDNNIDELSTKNRSMTYTSVVVGKQEEESN